MLDEFPILTQHDFCKGIFKHGERCCLTTHMYNFLDIDYIHPSITEIENDIAYGTQKFLRNYQGLIEFTKATRKTIKEAEIYFRKTRVRLPRFFAFPRPEEILAILNDDPSITLDFLAKFWNRIGYHLGYTEGNPQTSPLYE